MARLSIFLRLMLLLQSVVLFPQSDKTSELKQMILSRDSLLFSIGFNQCDVRQFENLLSEDFEFYHDKGGRADKKKFLEDFKNGLCKKSQPYCRRELIPESTEVYPLYDAGKLYGAVQNGSHLFYESEQTPGFARFTHLWILENGQWRLKRSLSFDHQPQTPEAIDFSDRTSVEKWLAGKKVMALSVGVIRDGKLAEIRSFGQSDIGKASAYNSIFNVASLTKPITAMVALQLVNSGKWNLDEPIHRYFVDRDVASDPRHRKLTTRLILSHQTGFKNWCRENPDRKLAFDFDPGTKYGYSGEGFEYLRKAMEKKFGKSLRDLAKELVFEPLGMTDSDYIWNKNTDASRFVTGFNKDLHPYKIIRNTKVNAADDLLTTISDYGKFIIDMLDGARLKPELYREMISPQVTTKKDKSFGLGWEIYDLGQGETAISHGGSDEGTQCLTFFFPKTRDGILIFTNSDIGYSVFNPILLHYLSEKGKKLIDIETRQP